MRIKYLGKASINNMFKCQMCTIRGRDRYSAVPQLPSLVDWNELIICKKCAKREVGSRNKKEWERIHK